MKKKTVSAILASVMCISMLFGCSVSTDTGDASSNEESAEETDASAGDVTEISWIFYDDLDVSKDLVTIGYKEVIDRFNKDFEGKYHVNVITTPTEEYDTKLNALIASGDVPELFTCHPGPLMEQYVDAGVAADLTDILETENPDWYATFKEGIFDKLTYDGKIMAIPTNFSAALVFYNTEIFDEVGVTPPETYDEWLEVCKKIQDAGYTPIACSAKDPWCISLVAGYLCDREGGPDNLDGVSEGTLDWTSESYVNAGEKLIELSQYFQPTAAGDSNDQVNASFTAGEAAMLVQGSWVIGEINGLDPAIEDVCGAFRFPAIEGGADPNRMMVKTDNIMLSSEAEGKEREAAIELLKYFTDETAEKYVAEEAGKIPTTNVEVDISAAPKQYAYIEEVLDESSATFGFYNESLATAEAGDIYDDAIVEIYLKNATPEEAFQELQDYYEKNVW